jgi:hypothetical protein
MFKATGLMKIMHKVAKMLLLAILYLTVVFLRALALKPGCNTLQNINKGNSLLDLPGSKNCKGAFQVSLASGLHFRTSKIPKCTHYWQLRSQKWQAKSPLIRLNVL